MKKTIEDLKVICKLVSKEISVKTKNKIKLSSDLLAHEQFGILGTSLVILQRNGM